LLQLRFPEFTTPQPRKRKIPKILHPEINAIAPPAPQSPVRALRFRARRPKRRGTISNIQPMMPKTMDIQANKFASQEHHWQLPIRWIGAEKITAPTCALLDHRWQHQRTQADFTVPIGCSWRIADEL
jgi:hypothetical protein